MLVARLGYEIGEHRTGWIGDMLPGWDRRHVARLG